MIGLGQLADLYRPSTSTNSYNETVYSYPGTPTRSNVSCRLSSLTLDDREKLKALGSAVSETGARRIMFAGAEDVRVKDRIKYGSDVWEIIGIEDVDRRGIVLETFGVTATGVIA